MKNPSPASVVCRACWRLPVHSIVTNGIRPKGGSGKLKNDGEIGSLEYDHLTVEYMYEAWVSQKLRRVLKFSLH